jgi:hypothetical protein
MLRVVTVAAILALATVVGAETLEGLSRKIDAVKDTPVSVNSQVSVTNGSAVTLRPGVNQLFATGSPNNGTNTITLAVPVTVGTVYYIVNVGTSNKIAIAESGTWLSDALEINVDTGYTVVSTAADGYRKF